MFCPVQAYLLQQDANARDTILHTTCFLWVLPFFFFFLKAFYLLHSQQLLYIMLNPAKLLTSTVAKKTLAGASREILESIK